MWQAMRRIWTRTTPDPSPQDAEAPRPTAVMLSHVYALKDIMTAIAAAAVIVHDYGVTDYALESEPARSH